MSLAFFVLLLAVAGFLGTMANALGLAMGAEGFMKDFLILNLIGAAHLLILALVGGMWLIS